MNGIWVQALPGLMQLGTTPFSNGLSLWCSFSMKDQVYTQMTLQTQLYLFVICSLMFSVAQDQMA